MPLVIVSYKEVVLDRGGVQKIIDALPHLVANALSVRPDGQLEPQDIDVWSRFKTSRDISRHDIGIVIFANYCKERESKLSSSTLAINNSIAYLLAGTGLTGFVSILLAPAGFAEFQASTFQLVETEGEHV